MVVFSNAKINLGLNILSKRPDGFHNIESCFYPVQWTDILEIIPAETSSFTSSGMDIPGDPASNLCVRAYDFIKQDLNLSPVHIHLHKVIPIGAGLGGGSANGAFTIKLLNSIFELGLSTAQMQAYARKLGSDCAFFIENTPVFCYNKGDEFSQIQINLTNYYIVLINPQIHVSTAQAYTGVVPKSPATTVQEALQMPISAWRNHLVNDFETTVFARYPVIASIKEKLYSTGALYASMSGTGSTVYGIFEKQIETTQLFPENYQLWQGKL